MHFRESCIPTRDEVENTGLNYDEVISAIEEESKYYDIQKGVNAALKGGVWMVGTMGNTAWGPVGKKDGKKTLKHY